MKPYLFFSLMTLVFISCKKNDTPPSNPDSDESIIGTWRLSQSSNSGNLSGTYDAVNFPCLLKNIFIVKNDGTYEGGYIGTDTCYLINTMAYKFMIGIPQSDPLSGTWKRTASSSFKFHSSSNFDFSALLTKRDNVEYLIFTSTHSNSKTVNDFIR